MKESWKMKSVSKVKLKNSIQGKANTYHLRGILTATFLLIISIYIVLIFAVRYVFYRLGITEKVFFNPTFVSYSIITLCVILAFVTYNYILNKILKPLTDLGNAAKKVGEGDYGIELSYNGHVKELQNAINNFNKMSKEISSVELIRNDFIANVSHEFKTPLSSIMGYVTLLQDSDITEEEKSEYISKTFFNIEKLNDLTENILRLSKLENQNYPCQLSDYRLDEQIREAVVLLEPKWSEKNISFDIDMPEINYMGVQSLIFQVWVNIISNAIKFSGEGGIITISMKAKTDNIMVWFSDDGIGMTKETQEHIFDKFYQGDTSRRSQGNGLGLTLCREILNSCNGKIYVTSELGLGSTFMVELLQSEPYRT